MVSMISQWILSLLIFFPLLGAVLIGLVKDNQTARHLAVAVSVLELIFSLHLVAHFNADSAAMQFAQDLAWLPRGTGIRYTVGVDGISLLLVMLTTVLCPLVFVSSYSSIESNVKSFLALFLILESAMIGALVSLDLVLFYVFWEAMLIPMYFIIGVWGGKDRIYATTKFFIYTVIGSLLMLVAFSYLYYLHYQQNGVFTTSIIELYKTAAGLPADTQLWLFTATAVAFAIKVPLFPFHTWLPDAHVQAPTPGSVILAGVLLKMGTYGLMRMSIPMFPEGAHRAAPVMLALSVIGIVYGALIAWRQTDIKKLVAYSSVSHLGFVVAGLFAFNELGYTGALYQMVNHGVSTGALFLLIGVVYERRHTREMSEYGGLAKQMPWYAFFFLVATMGSVALPGTGGFIGEWLILNGVFQTYPAMATVAGTGVILGAIYMLWLVLKVIWGPLKNEENKKLLDCSPREAFVLATLSIFVFLTGFLSAPLLAHTEPTMKRLQESVVNKAAYKTELVIHGRSQEPLKVMMDH
ncbi:NADH-quinone oxidoreductase subunit M [bacterium]|nr:NADH-quinone oxidoreductase subunit M [bacterium]